MNEKKNNNSLFLYTALIFLVALLMIVISFFGQSHLEGIKATEQKAKTITERASMLSDENLHLTEQVSSLNETIEEKDDMLQKQQETIDLQAIENTNLNSLVTAYKKLAERKRTEAKEIIETVNPDALSEDAKYLYEYVKRQTK